MVTPTPTITVKSISNNFVEPAAPGAAPVKGPNSIDVELETKLNGQAGAVSVIIDMQDPDCLIVPIPGQDVNWYDNTNYKGFRLKSGADGSLKFSFFGEHEAIIKLHIYPENFPDAEADGLPDYIGFMYKMPSTETLGDLYTDETQGMILVSDQADGITVNASADLKTTYETHPQALGALMVNGTAFYVLPMSDVINGGFRVKKTDLRYGISTPNTFRMMAYNDIVAANSFLLKLPAREIVGPLNPPANPDYRKLPEIATLAHNSRQITAAIDTELWIVPPATQVAPWKAGNTVLFELYVNAFEPNTMGAVPRTAKLTVETSALKATDFSPTQTPVTATIKGDQLENFCAYGDQVGTFQLDYWLMDGQLKVAQPVSVFKGQINTGSPTPKKK
ncbi:hypothetical protein D8666_05845 [Ochrobactrum soli]|uniref:hypothetical protein n=1 Tax=Ochrobactrum soli TaxID=2448455 RepID=UPI000EF1FAB4|nr:hypothetical protein [[Ochrobactrum] soli]RLL74846.1 hypothetical protein D8666_05845 [[Ochrobactrum] soli]